MSNVTQNPQELWLGEIMDFLQRESSLLVERYGCWMRLSGNDVDPPTIHQSPVFPLVPASKGFCLTLNKSLQTFERIVGTALKKRLSSLEDPNNAVSADTVDSADQILNVSDEANLSR